MVASGKHSTADIIFSSKHFNSVNNPQSLDCVRS